MLNPSLALTLSEDEPSPFEGLTCVGQTH
jgi:hypothetical protein